MRKTEDRYMFTCPACGCCHGLNNTWTFNDDFDKPTFRPSILVRGKRSPTDEEVERIMAGNIVKLPDQICHSFVTNGQIQYLSDCTHIMAGQTVEIPDWVDQ